MNVREIPRLLTPARWALVGAILLVVAAAVWFVLIEPGRQRQRAAEAKAEAELSAAAGASARDALKTYSQARDREWTTDQQAKEAEDEIRAAPDDDRNAIARARLCMSDAYARDPSCVELRRSRPE
jgi:flagellar biosynthesis/type III secretory pathway M-ring protein FliF/YscJ